MVAWKSYQDFIDAAVQKFGGKAGGQTRLARAVNAKLPPEQQIKPQTIQYLQRRTGKKPARKSGLTHLIAQVAGLPAPGVEGEVAILPSGAPAGPTLEKSQELGDVELSKAALELVRAWNALPLNERMAVKRHVESAALRYLDPVPDGALHELAAPGTPTAAARRKSRSTQ